MNKIQRLANPNCEECGGEGICHYARGEDDYTDTCDTCFPGGLDNSDDEYDEWRDNQL